jgi:hypothetical protein
VIALEIHHVFFGTLALFLFVSSHLMTLRSFFCGIYVGLPKASMSCAGAGAGVFCAKRQHLKDTHTRPSFDGELGSTCENSHCIFGGRTTPSPIHNY